MQNCIAVGVPIRTSSYTFHSALLPIRRNVFRSRYGIPRTADSRGFSRHRTSLKRAVCVYESHASVKRLENARTLNRQSVRRAARISRTISRRSFAHK